MSNESRGDGDRKAAHVAADKRQRWLDLLLDITAIANDEISLEAALLKAIERVCENNGWQAGFCFLRGQTRHLAWPVRPESVAGSFGSEALTVASEWAIRVMEQEEIELIEDLRDEEAAEAGTGEPRSGLSEIPHCSGAIAIPLRAADNVFGALVFLSRDRLSAGLSGELLEDHLSVMAGVGTQLGRAVERWMLFRRMAEEADKEREALGREIHDGLAQQLVGIRLLAENLHRKSPAGGEEGDRWSLLLENLQTAQQQARALAHGLSPGALAASADSLMEELARLQELVETGSDIQCKLRITGSPSIERSLVRSQLARIAREAVLNAVLHADPRRIDILLEAEGDRLVLEVRDDGSGFSRRESSMGGLGMANMRYRSSLIDARLEVVSEPTKGTTVRCLLEGTRLFPD